MIIYAFGDASPSLSEFREGQNGPAEDTMRDILALAWVFYGNPRLRVSDVRPTRPIDIKNITLRFQVNLRYMNQ